jgi:hypothetical protein
VDQSLGAGQLDDDPTPYYMNMQNNRGHDQWELAYPVNFFACLAHTALADLRAYLEKHQLNPYEAYKFGSHWTP